MTSKCLLGLRRTEEQWQEELQEVRSPHWGWMCLLVGQRVGLPRHARPPLSLLRAAGGFPLLSMGFGSSPWHAACLFWMPSEAESILSMAALSPSPLEQLLLAPPQHGVTPLGKCHELLSLFPSPQPNTLNPGSPSRDALHQSSSGLTTRHPNLPPFQF